MEFGLDEDHSEVKINENSSEDGSDSGESILICLY